MPADQPLAPRTGGPAVAPASSGRLLSVDALRGFDLFWILGADDVVRSLVGVSRNPLTEFLDRQFEHVQWEGLHVYDVIYPLFIFLVGVSIALSHDKTRESYTKREQLGRILRRGMLLYLLNFIFNGGFSTRWPDMRVASGVLALIAASYVIAALIYCFLAEKLKMIAVVVMAVLLGYWALLGLTPFPDFQLDKPTVDALATKAGSHSPAQIAAQVPDRVSGLYGEGRNFSNYVDFRFMPGRLLNRYYENQGLLSPISASTVCLLGALAARLLMSASIAPRRRVLLLALGGVTAILIGLIWSLEFPVVKKLWSSSFCLVTSGCSALLLAAFYLLVDVWGARRWCQPFIWIGSNSIVLYVLSALVDFPKIAERLSGGNVREFLNRWVPGLGATAVAAIALLLMVTLARFLYQRRIFIRV